MARRRITPEEREKAFRQTLFTKPKRYVLCRDYGHAWQVLNDFHHHLQVTEEGSVAFFVARDFSCIRCESTKKEIYLVRDDGFLERHGNTKYDYSEQYKLPPNPTKVSAKAEVRRMSYLRTAIDRARENL